MSLRLRRFGVRKAAEIRRFLLFGIFLCAVAVQSSAQGREDEIVANLAAGRVIVHVTNDGIAFAAIEQSAEPDSIAPRVVSVDSTHIGVLLGATEWQIPAGSKPIRVESKLPRAGSRGDAMGRPDAPGGRLQDENSDLELIGISYLEALRALASQLHQKIELGTEEPLLQIVVIGYAPGGYGPEVWLYEYRVVQEAVRGEYYQTRVLRPRTMQLYPPEKHEPRTLLEVRYASDTEGPSLRERIQRNDPVIARITNAEPKFRRVIEKIQAGKANGANFTDAADFLRAAVVPLAGKARFFVGTLREDRGLDWLVPPEEPVQKAKEDKDRPPDAPTLRRTPKP